MSKINIKSWLFAVLLPIATFAACADDAADPTPLAAQNPQPNTGGQGSSTSGAGGSSGSTDPNCVYEGPPLLDVNSLQACPSYVCGGGAHCLPKALVPDGFADQLADCNKDLACVPDHFIETGGDFIVPTCQAIMGLEGRCLSTCIPQVSERADFLQQGACGEFELCVPCFDPLTNESTGACDLSCDIGPSEPAPTPLPSCCGNDEGTCIPGDLVPGGQASSLAQDKCPDTGQLCVPNQFLDATFNPIPCAPDFELQLLGIEDGACLPECVDAVKGIGAGSCPSGYKCAPCDVLGESTGACDDDW